MQYNFGKYDLYVMSGDESFDNFNPDNGYKGFVLSNDGSQVAYYNGKMYPTQSINNLSVIINSNHEIGFLKQRLSMEQVEFLALHGVKPVLNRDNLTVDEAICEFNRCAMPFKKAYEELMKNSVDSLQKIISAADFKATETWAKSFEEDDNIPRAEIKKRSLIVVPSYSQALKNNLSELLDVMNNVFYSALDNKNTKILNILLNFAKNNNMLDAFCVAMSRFPDNEKSEFIQFQQQCIDVVQEQKSIKEIDQIAQYRKNMSDIVLFYEKIAVNPICFGLVDWEFLNQNIKEKLNGIAIKDLKSLQILKPENTRTRNTSTRNIRTKNINDSLLSMINSLANSINCDFMSLISELGSGYMKMLQKVAVSERQDIVTAVEFLLDLGYDAKIFFRWEKLSHEVKEILEQKFNFHEDIIDKYKQQKIIPEAPQIDEKYIRLVKQIKELQKLESMCGIRKVRGYYNYIYGIDAILDSIKEFKQYQKKCQYIESEFNTVCKYFFDLTDRDVSQQLIGAWMEALNLLKANMAEVKKIEDDYWMLPHDGMFIKFQQKLEYVLEVNEKHKEYINDLKNINNELNILQEKFILVTNPDVANDDDATKDVMEKSNQWIEVNLAGITKLEEKFGFHDGADKLKQDILYFQKNVKLILNEFKTDENNMKTTYQGNV